MTLLWTTPRSWQTKEPITKTKLNTISDQLKYLYNPTRVIYTNRGSAANLTTSSATFVDMDYTTLALALEMTGSRDLTISLQGNAYNSLATYTYFDILMDGSTYMSTLTGTPTGVGVYFVQHAAANAYMPINLRVIIPKGQISAGVHTFSPRWRVASGTATWVANTAWSQFFVGEIS